MYNINESVSTATCLTSSLWLTMSSCFSVSKLDRHSEFSRLSSFTLDSNSSGCKGVGGLRGLRGDVVNENKRGNVLL